MNKELGDKVWRFWAMLSMLWQSKLGHPIWALIFITRRCGQNCSFCYVSERSGKFMGIERFRGIVDHLKGLGIKTISLFGGNITLHPQLSDMVEYIRRRRCFSYLSIDLTSCSAERLEQICWYHPDVISFSCDRLESATGDRRGFDLVKDRIKLVQEVSPRTLLQCNLALVKENIEEIPILINLLHDLCGGRIGFTVFPTSFPFVTKKDISEAKKSQIDHDDVTRIERLIAWINAQRQKGWCIMNPSSYLSHLVDYLKGEGTWNCSAQRLVLTLDEEGKLMQCSYQPPEGLHRPLQDSFPSFTGMWGEVLNLVMMRHGGHGIDVCDLDSLTLKEMRRVARQNREASGCIKNCFSQAYACTAGYGESFPEWFRLLRNMLRA